MVKKNAVGKKEKGKRKTKKASKKDGPKKPLSAFMFFSQERRKTLKNEKPDLKITEASVVIGAEWKELSQKDREPYNELAKEDRSRYEKEKGQQDPAPKPKEKKKKQSDDEDDEEEEEKEDIDSEED